MSTSVFGATTAAAAEKMPRSPFDRLPAALVATRVCTQLDLADHTRLATASTTLRALCCQECASPDAVAMDERIPSHAIDARPWLRPSAVDVVAVWWASRAKFPARLLANARQLVWRLHHHVDPALLDVAVMPRLERLSLPDVNVTQWRLVVDAVGTRLHSLERHGIYGPPSPPGDTVRSFPFAALRQLALSPPRTLLDCVALRGLARTCPLLECLEASFILGGGGMSGANDADKAPIVFHHLDRLHVVLAAAEQRTLEVLICTELRAPRLRHLEVATHAGCTDLRPLAAFASSLETLELRRCRLLHVIHESDLETATGTVAKVDGSDFKAPPPPPPPPLVCTKLPSSLPHLQRFSPPRLYSATAAPRSPTPIDTLPLAYAATLTELEVAYWPATAEAATWPRLLLATCPRLRHLALYDVSGVTLSGCVALAVATAEAAAEASGTTVPQTLTLKNGVGDLVVYDLPRAAAYLVALEPLERATIDWFGAESLVAPFRRVDRALLDERVLAAPSRAFGTWHVGAVRST